MGGIIGDAIKTIGDSAPSDGAEGAPGQDGDASVGSESNTWPGYGGSVWSLASAGKGILYLPLSF